MDFFDDLNKSIKSNIDKINAGVKSRVGKEAINKALRGLISKLDNPVRNGVKHAKSRATKVGGRNIPNHKWAGKIYPSSKLPLKIREKYPYGVPFNNKGYPDFSRYSIKKVYFKDGFNDRASDFLKADKIAKVDRANPDLGKVTWHHHENGKDLLLVPADIHNAVAHLGGIGRK